MRIIVNGFIRVKKDGNLKEEQFFDQLSVKKKIVSHLSWISPTILDKNLRSYL